MPPESHGADDAPCVICGGVNDSSISWQTFCRRCAQETWGPAVVAKFIETAIDCSDRLAAAERTIAQLQHRIDQLEARQ
jgi:hypothetical protein